MATLLTKKSDTSSSVPLAADLTNAAGGAELAVNTADKRLYTKTSGGTVVELGTNPSAFSNNPTFSAGTANGVAYLNGSKVLTSGSALQFDGANLAVGGTAIEKITTNGNIASTATQAYVYSNGGSGTAVNAGFLLSGSDNTVRFLVNDTEQMRLTSTGLGIGTSSPGSYSLAPNLVVATATSGGLTIRSGTTGYGGVFFADGTSGDEQYRGFIQYNHGFSSPNDAMIFGTAGASRATLDSSGNLGLGVTPSAWSSAWKVIESAGASGVVLASANVNPVYLGSNWYSDGTNRYKTTGAACLHEAGAGSFKWYTAPSGTAGNAISFTQAMTLDASGDLTIGATTNQGSRKLSVNGIISIQDGSAERSFWYWDGSKTQIVTNGANPTTFWTNSAERARIDSSGNLLVGLTSSLGGDTKLQVKNGSAAQAPGFFWNATATGDANFVAFATETSVTQRGSITYNRGAGLVAYNVTSDYRAKDIIGPVTDSGVLIDSVPVYMGKMKGATQERPMFIAHETPEYAHTGEKDAVDADGNPVYQQMDASALIPVMWAEIQSLRQRLAAAGIA